MVLKVLRFCPSFGLKIFLAVSYFLIFLFNIVQFRTFDSIGKIDSGMNKELFDFF